MMSLLQDLRLGSRMVAKAPGATAAMVVTLALGIGANTAIFSYVDATWLRPLAVPHADRLVRVFTTAHDSRGDRTRGPSSYVDYADLRDQATAFADVVSYERRGALLYMPGDVAHIVVEVVSPNYFTGLGAPPVVGRTFTDADERAGDESGVVISYELWRERFGGDPSVAGRHVRLTNGEVAIRGVMPKTFRGVDLQGSVEAWIPPAVWSRMTTGTGSSAEFTVRANRRRDILARLRAGVGLPEAQSQLDVIGARLAREFPESNKDRRFTAIPEMETRAADARAQGVILLAIAVAVALIASANVANLQMARAEARRRETATRLALGGGRGRLVRQWLAESLIVSAVGAALAILLAGWLVHVLPALFTTAVAGAPYDFRLDSRALIFTMGIALSATVVFGIAPALQASSLDVASALKGSAEASAARRGSRLRDVFVVTQVATSIVLLLAAGLLVRTLERLRAVDPGFNPRQNVLLLNVVPELARRSASELHDYYRAVQERLAGLPGVERVSITQRVPFSPSLGGAEKEIVIPGVEPPPGRTGIRVNFDVVGPGYFPLVQTRLRWGRFFGPEDGPDAVNVAIVNETMARRFWSGPGAVGQRLRIAAADYIVVGVVEDTKWETLTEAARPLLYFPTTQQLSDSLTILLRTRADPGSLTSAARAELQRIDSRVPLLSAVTLQQHMDFTLNDERIRAKLTSAFAGLGLLLAAAGLYGVLSFVVARRTREIGIRVALGADRREILRLVFGYGLRRVLAGMAIGLIAALLLGRLIARLLFGVTPTDPAALALVVLVLLVAAALAVLVPAVRATRVEPAVALRLE